MSETPGIVPARAADSATAASPHGYAAGSDTRTDPTRSRVASIAVWAWGVVLTMLYALVSLNAVGNLLGMQQIAAALDTQLSVAGWFWLVFGAALPLLVYAVALVLARGSRAGTRLLVLLTGLAVLSAFQLEITHLVPQYLYFAV